MLRQIGVLTLVIIIALGAGAPLVLAQDGPHAQTLYALNMRTGPDTAYDTVMTLGSGVPLLLEARNTDTSWVLGRTIDGAYRGWLAAIYLSYTPGFTPAQLPVSDEIVPVTESAPEAPPAETPPDQPNPAVVPGSVRASTVYQLNVRSGPATTHDALGQAAAGTVFVLEGRNAAATWVLGRAETGSMRGWLAAGYLSFLSGAGSDLPISTEIVNAAAPPPEGPTGLSNEDLPTAGDVTIGAFDPASVAGIDLLAYPIVGRATSAAHTIYQRGRALGNDPHYVTKVGDCFSDHEYFLNPFGWNTYSLGEYTSLQGVIDHFHDSLSANSLAASVGFLAGAVMDDLWRDPILCEEGESPLLCEYRLNKPVAAIIMFGTQDLLLMTPAQFNSYLREVVRQTSSAGVIPILSTFPGNLGKWDQTILYNQIVVRIALDFNVPLINLWRALEDLPNHGLGEDGNHLSFPLTLPGDLSYPNLESGYVMRNLVTLQTLDAIWRSVIG
ncbi:MAG: hypothetical protein JXQ72_04950 [Anaerolineae bacterium]|nr:hypothetical protein [Anaerolineae bacterium]